MLIAATRERVPIPIPSRLSVLDTRIHQPAEYEFVFIPKGPRHPQHSPARKVPCIAFFLDCARGIDMYPGQAYRNCRGEKVHTTFSPLYNANERIKRTQTVKMRTLMCAVPKKTPSYLPLNVLWLWEYLDIFINCT